MTLGQLLKSIAASEKREEKERTNQAKLSKQLAETIAKRKGIVIGRRYYVLPLGLNGRDGRKFPAEVVAVDRYWQKGHRGNHISVLVKFFNRNGAFKTEWFTTVNNEFTRIERKASDEPKSNEGS